MWQDGGAPGPARIWQHCIPTLFTEEAMGVMVRGESRSRGEEVVWEDRGGARRPDTAYPCQTECRVYAAPPERLDDMDAQYLTAVMLPNSALCWRR